MPNWTKEQTEAINDEGYNILVSAGAGSGKTAVLSERALRKVQSGVNIDQILILTFTKAAAYEMMIRIRNKIKKAGLDEQVNRIDKSYITTFDSFALSIVKKYHDRLNLKSNVSIIDENVISLLKKEILDDIFDKYYHQNDINFEKLITDFCLRDDKELKNYILEINDKLDLRYDKEDFLNSYLNSFFNINNINNKVLEYETLMIGTIDKINTCLSELELVLDGDNYIAFYDLLEPLLNARTYDDIKNNIDITLPRLPKNSGDDVKNSKERLKTYLDSLQEMCLFDNKQQMIDDYLDTKDYIDIIIKIILELNNRITQYKNKYDSFEFIDISKLAIDLVMKYPDIKEELKAYFNEIMIDEYQDTSDLQEQFISLIENNNTYMVGDIKQSIYRFRNANPFIFKYKYDKYSVGINGKKIDLNKNFRSRGEVLNNINKIFDCIMDDDFGGASYKTSHQMIFGNDNYINKGSTEQKYDLDIYNYSIEKDSKYTKDEIEAFIIADDISKKMNNKYQVFDKDTECLRDIKYSDFVILMDRSSKFTLYKKVFEYLKVPLTILKDENILDQNEVYLIRNILKLIESLENKDYTNTFKYSFISIARSYLFSYSDQEIFDTISSNSYFNNEVIKKAQNIVDMIEFLDLESLISKIIEIYDFNSKLITIGNVQMGISVLEYFLDLANNLQTLDYDYHRFIKYLDDIISSEKEIKIPVSVTEDDSCKIMTIHKSKGLEYSICYYSGLSASFNVSDLKEKVLFDNQYGIITPCFKNGYKDTFYKTLYKKRYYKEEIGEKIRLFYVALTRAREKMIVVTNLDEENTELEEGLVNTSIREQYRSFLDILKSIYEVISNYIVPINLANIPLSLDYKILNKLEINKSLGRELVKVDEYNINSEEVSSNHYSKTVNTLVDSKIKVNMQFGTRIHELLEIIDFKNPNWDLLELNDYERRCIENLLNQSLLKDIEKANIFKEYEFYTNDDIDGHGIIDLILEYNDHIDIIDYKLKNIDSIEYQNQLNGYKEYIERKTNKRTYLYLYSIIDNNFKSLNEED